MKNGIFDDKVYEILGLILKARLHPKVRSRKLWVQQKLSRMVGNAIIAAPIGHPLLPIHLVANRIGLLTRSSKTDQVLKAFNLNPYRH